MQEEAVQQKQKLAVPKMKMANLEGLYVRESLERMSSLY
jgi:hypothetical protein